MTFDPSKPCTTRDGRKVRILATDMDDEYSIVAIVTKDDGEEVETYTPDGRYFDDTDGRLLDLINTPETPRGLRGLRTYVESRGGTEGEYTTQELTDYLKDQDLVVVPRDAYGIMTEAMCGPNETYITKWASAIKAYEEG